MAEEQSLVLILRYVLVPTETGKTTIECLAWATVMHRQGHLHNSIYGMGYCCTSAGRTAAYVLQHICNSAMEFARHGSQVRTGNGISAAAEHRLMLRSQSVFTPE